MSSTADPMGPLRAAHSGYTAGHALLLEEINRWEERSGWADQPATHSGTRLAAHLQESYRTALEWVRQARALRERPALADSYGAGEVSRDQMQAISTLARPRTDEDAAWVEALAHWDIRELQREARKAKARELERHDGGRYLRLDPTPDERFVRVRGQLHPEEGAVLLNALDRSVPDATPHDQVDRRRADGLVALARSAVATDPDVDRATVVVHVKESTLQGSDDQVAALETGGFVPAATGQRLACDARIETVTEDMSRQAVGIGRASRKVPAHVSRQLRYRDQTCVFPGCENRMFVQAHHVTPWSQGGRTDLGNLVLVCTHHHVYLHEGGWRLAGPPGPHVTWIQPDGTPYRPRELVSAGVPDT